MKLANYQPSFRNVLFLDVRELQTETGILIPGRDFKLINEIAFNDSASERVKWDGKANLELAVYCVIKTGSDCTTIKEGDRIVLMQGIRPQSVEIDNKEYLSVTEGQIIGYERG